MFCAEKSCCGEGWGEKRNHLPQDSAEQMPERVWERKICREENSWETGRTLKQRAECKLLDHRCDGIFNLHVQLATIS